MSGRAPGVSIEAADPAVRPVAPARTDVAAFVGIAERGPLEIPVRVTSLKEFTRVFGTFVVPGFLAYAVQAFFENGGIAAWIVRCGAPAIGTFVTSVTDTRLTFGPALVLRAGTVVAFSQAVSPTSTARVLRHVVDADPAGAWIDVDAPLAGVDAREVPALDVSLPMLASSGCDVATTVLPARNGGPAVTVAAETPGTWGNRLALRVMRETVAQTVAVATPIDAFRRIPVASVAGFARGSFVRVRQGASTPSYRVVCDIDQAQRALIVASDDPGRAISPALNIPLPTSFTVAAGMAAVTVEALAVHLLVLENGDVVEDYPGCSPLFPDLWSARLARARSRIAIDAGSVPAASLDPDTWPADVEARALGGATDGVRMLSSSDVLRALATLAPVAEPTLIAIPDACAGGDVAPFTPEPAPPPPDCTDPQWLRTPYVPPPAPAEIAALPPQPAEPGPGFDAVASTFMAQGLVTFCESGVTSGDLPPHPSFRFALVDVPLGADPIDFRRSFDASRAAIHWPWAGVYDPLGKAGAVRYVPPSGHVAGAFAAMDVAIGPHHSAANTGLQWIVALAQDVDGNAQAVYNDEQINVIRALPNRGIRIYGARTLSSNASWLYVPVRRLVSMIESALLSAMQWCVFEPNSPTLRQLVRRSCLTLLDAMWQRGAFAGTSPAQAYYVNCDAGNNPPALQAAGELHVDIGVAPVRPAEFIIFRVGHQFSTLEVFEGAAA